MTKAALLHLLTEFSPVLAFFITGRFYDFYTATTVLLIFTVLSLLAGWLVEQRVALMPLIASSFVVIPGLITLYFSFPDALIFGDTLFYFLLAAAIGVGLYKNKYLLKTIFAATFAVTDRGWQILSYRWLILFLIAGASNEIVRIFFTPEVWVDFKFVKVLVISLFSLYQFKVAAIYRIPEQSNKWGLRTQLLPKKGTPAKTS